MEISQRAVKELIKHFTGQAQMLTIPRPFIRLTGDHECALMLNQIIYWSERTDDPEGWFYKTHDQWAEELELSPAQVRRIIKKLVEVGVESKVRKHAGAPKLHFRVNEEVFHEKLLEFLEEQKRVPIVKKVDNQESLDSRLSDPIINNLDNQQPSLLDSAQPQQSDSEQTPLSSSKDAEITAETTPEITHTHRAPAPSSLPGGNGKKVCVCSTVHGSKLCDEERIRIASNMPGVRNPERYAMTIDARRGTYDSVFLKRKKELDKPTSVPSEPERDISCCPDCHGKGLHYPAGDTPEGRLKGVAKCEHPRLESELARMEREVEEAKMEMSSRS